MPSSTLEEVARLNDPHFWIGDVDPVLTRLRNERPVFWDERGHMWALSRYADIHHAFQRAEDFSSAYGVTIGANLNHDEREISSVTSSAAASSGGSGAAPAMELLIVSDPPRHTQLRALVNKAFTPRVTARLEPLIRSITSDILDSLQADTVVDMVEEFAKPLPTYAIADLLGVPRGDRSLLERWSDVMVQVHDGVGSPEDHAAHLREVYEYFAIKMAERRSQPREDLITRLLTAEIDGQTLSEPSAIMFCYALLAGGNETTRSLLAGSIRALAEYPDQRDVLVSKPELIGGAVDDLLRWVSPIITICRTAVRDIEMRGQTIRAGDYVALLIRSGNRDEEIWERADELDVTRRSDQPHLGFGFGPHFCIGSGLARLEARVAIEELLKRFPNFQLTEEPQRAPSLSTTSHAVMPVRLG